MTRLSFKGDRCTVRFRGSIPQWSVEALGVEWDNPERGKNDGSLDGIRYFRCRVPGAGSFVKSTRAPDPETSFLEAVIAKYVTETAFEEIKLSAAKTIETVGIPKIHKRQAQINNLQIIGLEACCVSKIGSLGSFNFESLSRLDLSANLLTDFREVVELASSIPNLESLCLNDNRFACGFELATCTNVRELELARTLIEPSDIEVVLQSFPNLKSLGLAHNLLDELPPSLKNYRLEELDLSHNRLQGRHISELKAERVNLAYNDISQIPATAHSCQALVLTGVLLDWQSIDNLGSIEEVHFDHDTNARPFIIGRLEKLVKLNGTLVTTEEREDSEMYTLASISRKSHPPIPESRWEHLTEKYGEPTRPPNGSIRSRLAMCQVNSIAIRIVEDATVRRLAHIAARRLGLKVFGLELWTGDRQLDLDAKVGIYTETELASIYTRSS